MINFSRKPHPARNARIAATGIAVSGLIGMISVFNVNSQNAALAKTTADLKAAQVLVAQAQAAQVAQAAQPKPKIVYVTLPAKSIPHKKVQTVVKPAAVVQPAQQSHVVSGGSKKP